MLLILLCLLALFPGAVFAGAVPTWSLRVGDSVRQTHVLLDSDSSDNVVVVSSSEGALDFGGSRLVAEDATDVFVAKLDANGKHLWSRRLGGTGTQYALGLTINASNEILITGYFTMSMDFGAGPIETDPAKIAGTIYVVTLAPNGSTLHVQLFGESGGHSGGPLVEEAAGNTVLSGYAHGGIDFGGAAAPTQSSQYLPLAKLDREGGHIWSHFFWADLFFLTALESNNSGELFLAGEFLGWLDFGASVIRTRGDTNYDAFVVKFDANGTHVWTQHLSQQRKPDVALDSAGNVVRSLLGSPYLAKFTTNGASLWSKDASLALWNSSVATNSRDDVFLAGSFKNIADFGGGDLQAAGARDLFLAKFSSEGDHQWSERFGGTSDEQITGITVDTSGNIIAAGYFSGSFELDGKQLSSAGREDLLIVKFSDEPVAVQERTLSNVKNAFR